MSAKGTRPVPTSLDNWVGVTDLVISYKFLLHVLWSSPGNIVSVIGVGAPGVIERLCSSSRMDEPVVLEALRELDRRGLVALDEATREVAIRRWCAFHNFTGIWGKKAKEAYDEISSSKIKGILAKQEGGKGFFPIETPTSPPNSNSNNNNNSSLHARTPPGGGGAAAPPLPAKKIMGGDKKNPTPAAKPRALPMVRTDGRFAHHHPVAGVHCWYSQEVFDVEALILTHGNAAVVAAAKKIAEDGGKPYFSYVQKILKGKKNGNCSADFIQYQAGQQLSDSSPMLAAAVRAWERAPGGGGK